MKVCPILIFGILKWKKGTTISKTLKKVSEKYISVPRRIPKEIEEKSEEELTHEMLDFIERESLDDTQLMEVSRIFWQKKGLGHFSFNISEDISLKRLKVEDQVRKKLEELRVKKDRDLLYSIKPKVIEKAKKSGLKKLSESDIELFLIEDEKALPRRLLRMLRSLVNLELKE